jgi:hypothetical protein
MTATRPTLYPLPVIGWKEHVSLPLLGHGQIDAKIDTGARTAALHAEDISIWGRKVRFIIETSGRRRHCEVPLADVKRIKSSNGVSQLRPVIQTMIHIGIHQFVTLITLTDRADMGVPMLLGRDTLKGRFLVNPSRSYLLSRRKASA